MKNNNRKGAKGAQRRRGLPFLALGALAVKPLLNERRGAGFDWKNNKENGMPF